MHAIAIPFVSTNYEYLKMCWQGIVLYLSWLNNYLSELKTKYFADQIFGPTIKILVKKATNLKNVLKFGTIDPYAEVTFESKSYGHTYRIY